jgi:hypothetical protein
MDKLFILAVVLSAAAAALSTAGQVGAALGARHALALSLAE